LIAEEWPDIRAEGLRLRDAKEVDLSDVVSLLKSEREMQGLSLADIGKRTGLSKSALSRLENHTDVNPTISTLMRYAKALGKQLSVILTDV
jgi:transcriptional regulator with XRE-family HTH domain